MDQQEQMAAWSAWKSRRTDSNTDRLLDLFEKDIKSIVYTFSNADIPNYIIEAEATKNVIKGFETYDPAKNTSLRTHVNNYIKKTNRLVYDTQNVAKIPEARVLNIQKYKDALVKLTNSLNRFPSSLEIAEELGWDIKEVSRMRKSLRTGSTSEENSLSKMKYSFINDSALQYIYYSIPSNLKVLFEMLTGYMGNRMLSASEIKKELKISDKEYRRMRAELQMFLKKNKMQDLLE